MTNYALAIRATEGDDFFTIRRNLTQEAALELQDTVHLALTFFNVPSEVAILQYPLQRTA